MGDDLLICRFVDVSICRFADLPICRFADWIGKQPGTGNCQTYPFHRCDAARPKFRNVSTSPLRNPL
jgi:hypothetical protein